MGGEPYFEEQPSAESRTGALVKAFNWYSRFYGRKEAKVQLIEWANVVQHQHAKQLSRVDEREYNTSLAWLARLSQRGLALTEQERKMLDDHVSDIVLTSAKLLPKSDQKVKTPEQVSLKPSVQEIMRERASAAASELEGVLDDFAIGTIKELPKNRVMSELTSRNVLPQHINMLLQVWNKKLDEYKAVLNNKDSQLVEGYSNFTKTQMRGMVKFCEAIIADLNSYVAVKKSAVKPRARKPVSIDKVVSKFKYMKNFVDTTLKLSLESLHPKVLHGASEAWCYDTSKRKLHHYVADEYAKTFSVKGSTLLGYDKTKSEVKTLRKPAEQIKAVMGSKPAARKFFADIRAVAVAPNGRFNEHMIILKAW
jgi:hypothetical protein